MPFLSTFRSFFGNDRYAVDFEALQSGDHFPYASTHLHVALQSPRLGGDGKKSSRGFCRLPRRHHLWLLADEVYDRLYYRVQDLGDPVPSILRKAGRGRWQWIVTQSFSKTYCMTGWRVGWLISRRDLAVKATQLNEFIISHAPSFVQRAAQAALARGEEELRRMLVRLKENRDFCLAMLRQMPGVTVPFPGWRILSVFQRSKA